MADSDDRAHAIEEAPGRAEPAVAAELDRVRSAIRGIRFGEVRLIIQEGRIVQIERLEKQRFR